MTFFSFRSHKENKIPRNTEKCNTCSEFYHKYCPWLSVNKRVFNNFSFFSGATLVEFQHIV